MALITLAKTARAFKLKIGYAEASVKYTGVDHGKSTFGSFGKFSRKARLCFIGQRGDDFAWSEDLDIGEQAVVFIKKTAKVTVSSSKQFAVLARKLSMQKLLRYMATLVPVTTT
jgi:hypothetical protein